MLIQIPRLFIAVRCDVCGCPLVQCDLLEGSATITPMINAYGTPLCLACADALGHVVKHRIQIVREGYVTEVN